MIVVECHSVHQCSVEGRAQFLQNIVVVCECVSLSYILSYCVSR